VPRAPYKEMELYKGSMLGRSGVYITGEVEEGRGKE
jgi:hypothetical protein